jgi:hypothetical protein
VVRFLVENGFIYHHVYLKVEVKNGIKSLEGYAKYPESLKEAKEFVVKYKAQAISQ